MSEPAKCGACGGSERIGRESEDSGLKVAVACNCGVRGPWVALAHALDDAGVYKAREDLAIAAWNRMWAARPAGAMRHTLATLRAMKELSTTNHGERVGVELSVFRGAAGSGKYIIHPLDIDAALRERGVDETPPGREEASREPASV